MRLDTKFSHSRSSSFTVGAFPPRFDRKISHNLERASYSWPTISDGCRRMLSSKKDVPTLRHFHNLTFRKSPTIPFQLATLRITDKRTLFFLGSADLKTINLNLQEAISNIAGTALGDRSRPQL